VAQASGETEKAKWIIEAAQDAGISARFKTVNKSVRSSKFDSIRE